MSKIVSLLMELQPSVVLLWRKNTITVAHLELRKVSTPKITRSLWHVKPGHTLGKKLLVQCPRKRDFQKDQQIAI